MKIPTTFKALVEALIFAAQEPLSLSQIRTIYQDESVRNDGSRQVEPDTIRQMVADLNKEYAKQDRPYRIVQIAGGYQFATSTEYAEWLGKLYKEQGRRKLSQSGVETLAIIAYKQPITKAEVEKIRGVNCDYVLKTLLEKELLAVTGRAESVGRPLLYGTTREFLKHFGLNDITDLPRPREIEEILGESQFETERRMLEAQAGAEQARKDQEDFKSRLPHIPKKKPELDEKGVEIVPHKRTREIRIMPVEERKVLEEAGQEKIEFTSEGTLPVQQSPVVTGGMIQAPQELSQVGSPPEIPGELENQVPIFRSSENQPVETTGSTREPEQPTVQEIYTGETLSTTEELTQDAGQDNPETGMPQDEAGHQKKRWKVWKEKIQGFIKKLFA
ncbi:MAG: SMC-Scp complex subunit ScpB [Ignavibacteriae bacterium]|nr:MAG: SMC-Scp complex subunit ScpB [Ignavibacteriota bacterium]